MKGWTCAGFLGIAVISAHAFADTVPSSFIYDPNAGDYLYVMPTPGTWTQVQAEAQSYGGNLVTINSAADNQFILNNAFQDFSGFGGPNAASQNQLWMGYYDPTGAQTNDGSSALHASDFVWADGHSPGYTNWDASNGEPNNSGGREYYGAIYGPARGSAVGAWNDFPNAESFYGIAEVRATVPVPSQAPSVAMFPTPTSIYTASLTTFVQNHGAEFSSSSQQFLVANSTPAVVQSNGFWKGVATGSGSVLQFAGNTTDVILASQSVGDTAEYLALNALPAQFQNYASAVDIAAHLGADIATKDDPVVDLISANSFIWGQLVAPQLLSLGEDPPDPNYASPVVVTSFPDVTVPTGASSLTVALGHEFNDASQAAVYLQAANTAYNRYSTALANGDSISAGMQLESALYYMNMYRALISSAQTDVATVNVMLPVAAVGDETYSAQGLADLQAQIASSGLSASTMSDLESLGLSSDDINQITQNMMALDPNAYSGDLYGELNQVNGAITVPEPTTLGICGGSLVLLLRRRRRIDRVRVACQ